jgi:ribosome-associated heat shock protein Hsp15
MSVEKTRIDKWLWAVRLYKTRTVATDACRSGDVLVHDQVAKAAQLVEPGMHITVRKNGIHYRYEIIRIIEKRVGAPIAQTCYVDHTPEAELRKFEQWYMARTGRAEFREKGAGRPTKKERREIDRLKN